MTAGGAVEAKTKFQVKKLTEAVSLSRMYLSGTMTAGELGHSLGVTSERVSQIVRLGIIYMREAGWLFPAVAKVEPPATPPLSDRGLG